ncbi:hypothetical protein BXO88_09985 [Oribacterium sp. C9]|uniref:hypothetical protein n=1 Tax=Oribacterium sp. C9 TaxID=1943579 RepID=UPI00098EB754|nr:hypothetical protein [Oribacterium sp. C9]OON85946.1 hypothetical protein BXO88_09985 [Oribacterium sp. C9]
MKIKDAFSTYGKQIDAYTDKIRNLTKQKHSLEVQLKDDSDNAETLKKDYDKLELSIKNLEEARSKCSAFTEKVMELEINLHNMLVAKQQADAYDKAAKDMDKCMNVAAKYGRGEKVPAKDLQKLMQMYPELYKLAVAQRMMSELKDKKHKSEWENEEDQPADVSVSDEVAETEVTSEAPAPTDYSDIQSESDFTGQ